MQLYAELRAALSASCENYDRGNEWEAARLATTIFTLVHDDNRKIRSVLSQLGMRAPMRFVSSGRVTPGNTPAANLPLIGFELRREGSKAIPNFRLGLAADRRVQFADWWANERIFRDGQHELTRRRVVFALRHQDGGGHVGALTDPSYVRLKLEQVAAVSFNGQAPQPVFALTATMRQIAWELSETLNDSIAAYIS